MQTPPDIQTLFEGIGTACIGIGVHYLRTVSRSIIKLNQSIAIILEKTSWHEKILKSHDEKIEWLEKHSKRDRT